MIINVSLYKYLRSSISDPEPDRLLKSMIINYFNVRHSRSEFDLIYLLNPNQVDLLKDLHSFFNLYMYYMPIKDRFNVVAIKYRVLF